MKRLSLGIVCLLLAGCAFGNGFAGMDASQLKEWVKNKDAGVSCAHGVYAGATITLSQVNADKGVPTGMKVSEKCEIEFLSIETKKLTQ